MTYTAPADIFLDAKKQPTFETTDAQGTPLTPLLCAGAAVTAEEAKRLGLDQLDFNAHWAKRCAAQPAKASERKASQPAA